MNSSEEQLAATDQPMHSPNNDEALFPIAVLIDELKHEEVTYRLNAIRRLGTIALALGVERARDELIPFLEESIDDEDEVLLALAEEIATLVDYIGGPSYAHLLLTPLEHLATTEETVVRDKAAESIGKVADVLTLEQGERFYMPVLKRLSQGDWFTSRTSACAVYAPVYQKVSVAVQDDLRAMFTQLCRDDTPMVRRAAATQLGKLAKKVSKQHLISDLIPLFVALSQDEQDSVRLLCVDAVITVAESLTHDQCRNHLMVPLRSVYLDRSWRVRYVIAEKFVRLSKALGPVIVNEDLIGAYVHLLKDAEAEVRTAACTQLPEFCALIDKQQALKDIVPCVKELIVDGSQHVRAGIASQIGGLAPILGREQTIDHLLPLFLQGLKDEFPEVRLNIIGKLDGVNAVIGIDLLSQSLLPAIVELSEDKQWRVRLAIIDFMPLLSKQLGVKFFDEKLAGMCMSWLNDPIWSIREAATINLKRLTEAFGTEWCKATILPKILPNASHQVFTYRLTTLFSLGTISQALTIEAIKSDVLPTVLQLCKDAIPNIRFNAAKTLEQLVATVAKKDQQTSTQIVSEVKPVLTKMSNEDVDMDVKYFAGRALTVC